MRLPHGKRNEPMKSWLCLGRKVKGIPDARCQKGGGTNSKARAQRDRGRGDKRDGPGSGSEVKLKPGTN